MQVAKGIVATHLLCSILCAFFYICKQVIVTGSSATKAPEEHFLKHEGHFLGSV